MSKFDEMINAGDQISVPFKDSKELSRLRSAAYTYGHRNGLSISVKKFGALPSATVTLVSDRKPEDKMPLILKQGLKCYEWLMNGKEKEIYPVRLTKIPGFGMAALEIYIRCSLCTVLVPYSHDQPVVDFGLDMDVVRDWNDPGDYDHTQFMNVYGYEFDGTPHWNLAEKIIKGQFDPKEL